jgi:hypothetical protein
VSSKRAENVRNKTPQPQNVLAEKTLSAYQMAYACYTFADTLLDRLDDNESETLKQLLSGYVGNGIEENTVWENVKKAYLDRFYKDVLALACLVAEHQTINEEDGTFTCKAGCPFPISKFINTNGEGA